jgi:SRSO17 transposase
MRRRRRNSGFSTLAPNVTFAHLVRTAKLRWRIERDHLELKPEIGLGHFEGRGWRGFHHHATLCIAAYAFLVAERAAFSPLESALRHDHRNACPSRRLPAEGRCRSAPSVTYRIRLRLYDVRSPRAWSLHSSAVHAAPNPDQIEKVDYMSDAVVLCLAGLAQEKVAALPRESALGQLPLSRLPHRRAPAASAVTG